ncbi:MAG: hypothetical protein ABJB76_02725 [Candidatus Nitrosocosmicus sp.]
MFKPLAYKTPIIPITTTIITDTAIPVFTDVFFFPFVLGSVIIPSLIELPQLGQYCMSLDDKLLPQTLQNTKLKHHISIYLGIFKLIATKPIISNFHYF